MWLRAWVLNGILPDLHSAPSPGCLSQPTKGVFLQVYCVLNMGVSELLQTQGADRIKGPRLRGPENRGHAMGMEEDV